jgi:GLPGLI family protein
MKIISKHLYLNMLTLLMTICIYSQNNYEVKYKMVTLFDGVKNYDAKLTFSEFQSCFEYSLAVNDTTDVESVDENGNLNVVIPEKKQQKIYLDFKNKKCSEIKHLKSTFIVTDSLSIPKWNITSEIKNINNQECRKATTIFKGRKYEVWYATNYPSICGPWKLNGLPGLIIIAQDEKREVYFEAIEILKLFERINQPDNSIKSISINEFEFEVKKWQKDFEERLKAMRDRNTKIDIKFEKAVGIEITE